MPQAGWVVINMHRFSGSLLRTRPTPPSESHESKTLVRRPKGKPFLWCGQPRIIDRPNNFSAHSSGNLSNFRSDEVAIQDAMKNCSSTDLHDGSTSGRERNSLQALLRPCGLTRGFIFWSAVCKSVVRSDSEIATAVPHFGYKLVSSSVRLLVVESFVLLWPRFLKHHSGPIIGILFHYVYSYQYRFLSQFVSKLLRLFT